MIDLVKVMNDTTGRREWAVACSVRNLAIMPRHDWRATMREGKMILETRSYDDGEDFIVMEVWQGDARVCSRRVSKAHLERLERSNRRMKWVPTIVAGLLIVLGLYGAQAYLWVHYPLFPGK